MRADEHVVRFLRAETPCTGTATFAFERPPGYTFTAGQYFRLTVQTREGVQTHSFSHADAPGDNETLLLTRLTGSAFKDALLAMREGDAATFAGPYGRLTLDRAMRSVVFLVGGVGVAPARSIVRDIALAGRAVEVVLFDGNLDETCIPFRDEFDGYAASDPAFRVVDVLARPTDEWQGERGFITPETVRRHCDLNREHDWIICGPPAMVDAMRVVVEELGIPADRVHVELFSGYR